LETLRALEANWLVPTYDRFPFAVAGGKGCRVWDASGREAVDLLGGIAVNALGVAHPRLSAVLRESADLPWHTSNLLFHPYQGRLAERLCRLSGLRRAFFTNSGTEAVEAALKAARAIGVARNARKHEIVAVNGSFHGRTFGSLSVTSKESYRAPFGPGLPGVRFIDLNDVSAIEKAVGPATCAVILEPIQGESGVREATAEFAAAARAACDAHGALLILDEIQCGLGRTGAMFAFTSLGVTPDLVTLAKPLAGGLPLGALLAGEKAEGALQAGAHGTTFGGGPLACRMALAFLDVVEEEGLCGRARRVGALLRQRLDALRAARPDAILDVRGRGLMVGIDTPHDSRPLVEALLERGFLVGSAGPKTLRLLPPLVIQESDVNLFCDALEEVLERATTVAL
jgi:predicted acetylornithine/succinylornithine family transaminase